MPGHRPHRPHRPRRLAAAVLTSALLVGCAASGSGSGSGSGSEAGTTSSTHPLAEDAVRDEDLLTAADLPDGFEPVGGVQGPTSRPDEDPSDDLVSDPPACGRAIVDLSGAEGSRADRVVRFRQGADRREVQQLVAAGSGAVERWERIADLADGPCDGTLPLTSQAGQPATSGTVTMERLAGLGDEAVLLLVDIDQGEPERPTRIWSGVVIVRRGSTVSSVGLTARRATGSPHPVPTRDEILTIAEAADAKLDAGG